MQFFNVQLFLTNLWNMWFKNDSSFLRVRFQILIVPNLKFVYQRVIWITDLKFVFQMVGIIWIMNFQSVILKNSYFLKQHLNSGIKVQYSKPSAIGLLKFSTRGSSSEHSNFESFQKPNILNISNQMVGTILRPNYNHSKTEFLKWSLIA